MEETLSKLALFIIKLAESMTTVEALMVIMLLGSWVFFYFVLKVLWNAFQKSQENRIEENKKMITVQESTTTALNNLTKVVEVGFGVISSLGKK